MKIAYIQQSRCISVQQIDAATRLLAPLRAFVSTLFQSIDSKIVVALSCHSIPGRPGMPFGAIQWCIVQTTSKSLLVKHQNCQLARAPLIQYSYLQRYIKRLKRVCEGATRDVCDSSLCNPLDCVYRDIARSLCVNSAIDQLDRLLQHADVNTTCIIHTSLSSTCCTQVATATWS